jgi:hypothetical protein
MGQEAPAIVTRAEDLIPRVGAIAAGAGELAAARDRFVREVTDAVADGAPAYPDPRLVQAVEHMRDAWDRELAVYVQALSATVTVVDAAMTGQAEIELEAAGNLPWR